jgi:hypothetical protein
MSILVIIAGIVTAIHGLSAIGVGLLMLTANTERGWGLDRLAWAGVGFQLLGVGLVAIGLAVAGGAP